jgi:uncharacterized protein YcgI (DUF1989 family)
MDLMMMEGSCSTGQSPQWAVVPVEEELFSENRSVYEIMWKKYRRAEQL